ANHSWTDQFLELVGFQEKDGQAQRDPCHNTRAEGGPADDAKTWSPEQARDTTDYRAVTGEGEGCARKPRQEHLHAEEERSPCCGTAQGAMYHPSHRADPRRPLPHLGRQRARTATRLQIGGLQDHAFTSTTGRPSGDRGPTPESLSC